MYLLLLVGALCQFHFLPHLERWHFPTEGNPKLAIPEKNQTLTILTKPLDSTTSHPHTL